jgi:[ribosomal protein S5]-alanine N-acetyltransferase
VATPVLETQRLSLHELSAAADEDAAFIFRLLNEPSFLKNIGDRGVHSLPDAYAYLRQGPMASYQANGFGLYRVQLKATGETAGLCGLVKRATLQDPDLGYALLPEFWGSGYAVEAATAVLADARARLRLGRIVAITDPRNAASIGVLEKTGFKYEKMVQLTPDAIELKLFVSTPDG